MKHCRKCGVALTGENWTASYAKRSDCICRKCVNARNREYYKENTEYMLAKNRKFKEANPEYFSEHAKNNRGMKNAQWAKYYAAKLQRTPKWQTQEDRDAIKLIYESAPLCTVKGEPSRYEVDHIIPLQGEKVSGLHVPGNLQYMYPTLNKQKSNKHET